MVDHHYLLVIDPKYIAYKDTLLLTRLDMLRTSDIYDLAWKEAPCMFTQKHTGRATTDRQSLCPQRTLMNLIISQQRELRSMTTTQHEPLTRVLGNIRKSSQMMCSQEQPNIHSLKPFEQLQP
jgi:hypothetical protein